MTLKVIIITVLISRMTNVTPSDLNYDSYKPEQYDKDIIKCIPGHIEIHKIIAKLVSPLKSGLKVLELGVGTGITALTIAKNTDESHFILNDFSQTMLEGAMKKLMKYNCEFILSDYADLELPKNCDIVVSVIGMHHQENDTAKKKMMSKIYNALNKGGMFIFGDLMTYEDAMEAAYNDAKHYHFLVQNADDQMSLKEWAHHHKCLNLPVSWQVNKKWLKEQGFSVEKLYTNINTFLFVAYKY